MTGTTATNATPAATPAPLSWKDILYDDTNSANATNSIKKLTGIWEWTDYFENYFSIPGLVMPDPNTKFSELMEQELIKRVDMDNIVFKTNNLEQLKAMLGHEIIVFGQAIISTLKYIYDNDIKAYTIANGEKKTCGKDSEEEGKEEEEEKEESSSSSVVSSSSVASPSTVASHSTVSTQYDDAYKLYQAGQLEDCLAALNNILVNSSLPRSSSSSSSSSPSLPSSSSSSSSSGPGSGPDNNLLTKIILLKELCKI